MSKKGIVISIVGAAAVFFGVKVFNSRSPESTVQLFIDSCTSHHFSTAKLYTSSDEIKEGLGYLEDLYSDTQTKDLMKKLDSFSTPPRHEVQKIISSENNVTHVVVKIDSFNILDCFKSEPSDYMEQWTEDNAIILLQMNQQEISEMYFAEIKKNGMYVSEYTIDFSVEKRNNQWTIVDINEKWDFVNAITNSKVSLLDDLMEPMVDNINSIAEETGFDPAFVANILSSCS